MARAVRDAKLDSRAARARLSPRGKPYYRQIDQGLHLGYRRLNGSSGRWVLRLYLGAQNYAVEAFATADDLSDSNGVDILSFVEAVTEARARRDARVRTAAGLAPYTVADAIADYLKAVEARGKPTADTASRARAMIVPSLGPIAVADLTTEKIRAWLNKTASTPPRMRTPKGAPQAYRKPADDHESRRRRRATANRHFSILRAALVHAWREGKVASDEAWRRVKAFDNATAARMRYLTVAEAKRLINACEPDFRDLVRVALETGCRYGELCRLLVTDYDADNGTLAIRRAKSGKPRHIVLTDEGRVVFAALTAGRAGDELLLRRADGDPWAAGHQFARMREACRRAKISPAISVHGLRHTWASLAMMNGLPIFVVAKNLGHVDTKMVEKRYGHLAPSYVTEQIRAAGPRFGEIVDNNVRRLA